MKNIILTDNLDFVYSLKPLKHGEGGFAKCYFLDDSNIIKKYFDITTSTAISTQDVEYTLGIENDTYYFPHTLYETKDRILLATAQKLAEGENLGCLKRKVRIDDYFNAIDKVIEDTKKLGKHKIITFDIASSNMIYTPGVIKIIDSDLFYIEEHYDESLCNKKNLENVNEALLEYFVEGSDINCTSVIYDFIQYNEHLYSLYNCMSRHPDDYKLLKEFILCMQDQVGRTTGTSFNTIDQMQKAIIRRRV